MSQTPQVSTLDVTSGPDAVGPAGSVRISRDADGLVVSVDGGDPEPIGSGSGTSSGWTAERWGVANARISTLNRFTGTDLDDGGFFLGGGANAPTLVAKSGGVYATTAANGYINIGKTDSIPFIAAPSAESWYVAARVCNPAAAVFTSGKFNVLIGIASATGAIYIQGNQATSDTVYQLNLNDGSDHFATLGSVATIGATTCPVGSFYVIAMYFDVGTGVLTVEFNDTEAATFSGADLTHMITDAASIIAGYSNDTTLALQCDSLFYAYVAP